MVSHNLATQTAALTALMLIAAFVCGHLINVSKVRHIPQSTAAIVIGALSGLVLLWKPKLGGSNSLLTFNPEMFYMFMLPPIILEAGFTLDRINFWRNFSTILWLAVGGTLISAVLTTGGLYLLVDYTDLQGNSAERLLYCSLLGTLLAAVDPVATLGVLGGSRFEANEKLFSILFGESLLNDTVSIVIFRTLVKGAKKTLITSPHPLTLLYSTLWQFCYVSFTSCLIGGVTGLMTYVCFRSIDSIQRFPEYELGVVLLIAYFSFAMAEMFEGSGIVSLFITSILLGHYNVRNLSITSQRTAGLLFKVLSVFSESFIYLLFGLVITKAIVFSVEGRHGGSVSAFDWRMFAITMCLLIISRAVVIFPSASIINLIEHRSKSDLEEREERQVIARACMHAAFQKSVTSRYTPMAKSAAGDQTPMELLTTQCGQTTHTTYPHSSGSRGRGGGSGSGSGGSSESRTPDANDLVTPLLAVERTVTESVTGSSPSQRQLALLGGVKLPHHLFDSGNPALMYPAFGQRSNASPRSPYAEMPSFVSRLSASEFLDVISSPVMHAISESVTQATPYPVVAPYPGVPPYPGVALYSGVVADFSSQCTTSRRVNFQPEGDVESPLFEDARSVAGLPRFGFLPDGTAEVLARLPGQRIHEYVEELRAYRQRLKSENRLYTQVLDLPCQILLWMSGLRGAIAFVLALSVPALQTPSGKHNANLLVTTTLLVIVISTVAFGSFIELYALKYQIIRRVPPDDEQPEEEEEEEEVQSKASWRRGVLRECQQLWDVLVSNPNREPAAART